MYAFSRASSSKRSLVMRSPIASRLKCEYHVSATALLRIGVIKAISHFTRGWLTSMFCQPIAKRSRGVLVSMIRMDDESYFRLTAQNGCLQCLNVETPLLSQSHTPTGHSTTTGILVRYSVGDTFFHWYLNRIAVPNPIGLILHELTSDSVFAASGLASRNRGPYLVSPWTALRARFAHQSCYPLHTYLEAMFDHQKIHSG